MGLWCLGVRAIWYLSAFTTSQKSAEALGLWRVDHYMTILGVRGWTSAHPCSGRAFSPHWPLVQPILTSIFMIFGRTDLRISVSGAKFDAKSDFDVQKSLAPPKSFENDEKPLKKLKKKSGKKNGCQKIESCKSSETRFPKVSRRSERSSRGKRTFEVRRRLGGIREA